MKLLAECPSYIRMQPNHLYHENYYLESEWEQEGLSLSYRTISDRVRQKWSSCSLARFLPYSFQLEVNQLEVREPLCWCLCVCCWFYQLFSKFCVTCLIVTAMIILIRNTLRHCVEMGRTVRAALRCYWTRTW